MYIKTAIRPCKTAQNVKKNVLYNKGHLFSCICIYHHVLMLKNYNFVAVAAASSEPAFNLSVRRSPALALGDVAVLVWSAVSGIRGSICTSCDKFTDRKTEVCSGNTWLLRFLLLIFFSFLRYQVFKSGQNKETHTHGKVSEHF